MNKQDCDFCNLAGTAAWVYVLGPDRPIVGLANGLGDVALMDDDGTWRACIACSSLVDADDMTGLLDRVILHLGAVLPLRDREFRETWIAFVAAQYAAVMQPTAVKIPA
ncbi:hypothetical protein HW130_18470 [Streptomyces sp. PKU-EA00015]|uniref:hypothetical protein n=1 Tax=Streptomyces sp. PKU-EA00015 TaxID=2748326 RepID=UPI0015A2D8E3|nr:hypothetical protein [Streptomyces sp. PKU-EA00015]NWF28228.1 hypothetical protein [Streptomyces sp. PKU-EA00015]